jgi:hypothetical protein
MATLILNLVKRGIKAEPSAEALYELLQLADPNLKYSGMRLVTSRDKLFKQLKAAVHPDKHVAANYADANAVFQQLTNFYDGCATFDFSSKKREVTPAKEDALSAKRPRPTFPHKFNAVEHWAAALVNLKNLDDTVYMQTPQVWCYSARGYIEHHKLTGREAWQVIFDDNVFHKLPAGNEADSIKEELMGNGPVVSTSFKPSGALIREVRSFTYVYTYIYIYIYIYI